MIDETIFDDDFGCIINSAVRYSLGRYTYMPSTVAEFVLKYLNYLDNKTISVMICDIDEALKNEDLPLRKIWVELKSKLEIEMHERNN